MVLQALREMATSVRARRERRCFMGLKNWQKSDSLSM
jgi:hypothetical protein